MFPAYELNDDVLQFGRTYPGLLGVLIYSAASKEFEQKIRDAYQELHVESGDSILVFAGRPDWVSKKDRQRMYRDASRGAPRSGTISMMVSLPSRGRLDIAKEMITLRDRFDVKLSEVPCLLLLPQIESSDGHVFTFDVNAVRARDDQLIEILLKVFQACGKAVREKPCPVRPYDAEGDDRAYSELVEWRTETLGRVVPELNRLKLFAAARGLGPAVVGAALKGLAGLV